MQSQRQHVMVFATQQQLLCKSYVFLHLIHLTKIIFCNTGQFKIVDQLVTVELYMCFPL